MKFDILGSAGYRHNRRTTSIRRPPSACQLGGVLACSPNAPVTHASALRTTIVRTCAHWYKLTLERVVVPCPPRCGGPSGSPTPGSQSEAANLMTKRIICTHTQNKRRMGGHTYSRAEADMSRQRMAEFTEQTLLGLEDTT